MAETYNIGGGGVNVNTGNNTGEYTIGNTEEHNLGAETDVTWGITEADNTVSDSILAKNEAQQAQQREALARRNRQATANANMQVGQAGLQGTGAGNAMVNESAQQNQQAQTDLMLQQSIDDQTAIQNAQSAQLQAEQRAEAATREAERLARQQRQDEWDTWNSMVQAGDLEGAQAYAREKGLGSGGDTSRMQYDREISYIDGQIANLQAIANDLNQDRVVRQNATNQLEELTHKRQELQRLQHENIPFGSIEYNRASVGIPTNLDADRSYRNPNEAWTPVEEAAYRKVEQNIANLLNYPEGDVYVDEIVNYMIGQIGHTGITDFNGIISYGKPEELQELGRLLGLVSLAFAVPPNADARLQLQQILGKPIDGNESAIAGAIGEGLAEQDRDITDEQIRQIFANENAKPIERIGAIHNLPDTAYIGANGSPYDANGNPITANTPGAKPVAQYKAELKKAFDDIQPQSGSDYSYQVDRFMRQVNDLYRLLGLPIPRNNPGWRAKHDGSRADKRKYADEYNRYYNEIKHLFT